MDGSAPRSKGGKRLKLELRRKEKDLAEAAALLIASKKIQVIWGEDGDD